MRTRVQAFRWHSNSKLKSRLKGVWRRWTYSFPHSSHSEAEEQKWRIRILSFKNLSENDWFRKWTGGLVVIFLAFSSSLSAATKERGLAPLRPRVRLRHTRGCLMNEARPYILACEIPETPLEKGKYEEGEGLSRRAEKFFLFWIRKFSVKYFAFDPCCYLSLPKSPYIVSFL